jgi:hypothetical protein
MIYSFIILIQNIIYDTVVGEWINNAQRKEMDRFYSSL